MSIKNPFSKEASQPQSASNNEQEQDYPMGDMITLPTDFTPSNPHYAREGMK